MLAEAKALDQVSRMPALRMGGYQATSALIRYNGPAHWVLGGCGESAELFRVAISSRASRERIRPDGYA